MPYVNIPDSGLGGTVAKIVGKLLGQVSGQALDNVRTISNNLSLEGCPIPAQNNRLKNKQKAVSSFASKSNKKLDKFKKLPSKLKKVVSGLKAALKIILTLPIPQSVPPGFGLPINITTKYANLMHLLKEAIKQVDEIVKAIEETMKLPSSTLSSIQSVLSRAETVLKSCDIENALREEVANGNITEDYLKSLGIIDEDGIYIYSKLGPVLLNPESRFRGKWFSPRGYQKYDTTNYSGNTWQATKSHTSNINGGLDSGPPGVGPWILQGDSINQAFNSLGDSTRKLNDSSLDEVIKSRLTKKLVDFQKTVDSSKLESGGVRVGPNGEVLGRIPGSGGRTFGQTGAGDELSRLGVDESKFFHTGPNGIVYKLEIQTAPDSPAIAPQRFAVAKDPSGVIVLKGQRSFSSSTDILLDEIKFRIDNQLP